MNWDQDASAPFEFVGQRVRLLGIEHEQRSGAPISIPEKTNEIWPPLGMGGNFVTIANYPTKIWQSAVPWCFQTEWEWSRPQEDLTCSRCSPGPVVSKTPLLEVIWGRPHSKATDFPTRIHIKTSLCFMSITSLITWNLQWISQSFNGFPLGPRMFTLRAILRAAARTSSTWRTSSKGPLSWPYLAGAQGNESGVRRCVIKVTTRQVFFDMFVLNRGW